MCFFFFLSCFQPVKHLCDCVHQGTLDKQLYRVERKYSMAERKLQEQKEKERQNKVTWHTALVQQIHKHGPLPLTQRRCTRCTSPTTSASSWWHSVLRLLLPHLEVSGRLRAGHEQAGRGVESQDASLRRQISGYHARSLWRQRAGNPEEHHQDLPGPGASPGGPLRHREPHAGERPLPLHRGETQRSAASGCPSVSVH